MAWDELKQAELQAAFNDLMGLPVRRRALQAELAAIDKRIAEAKKIVVAARNEANAGI